MIAKQAASLDVLSGGRFELGLGSGAFWEAVRAMGGPVRSGREALRRWRRRSRSAAPSGAASARSSFEGEHYSVKGLHPGPAPVHPIQIWLGVGKPRALELTGRLADGWIPSSGWATADNVPAMQRHIDDGAAAAGRDPSEIRRLYNVSGRITDGPDGRPPRRPAGALGEALEGFASDLGFDTFIFWPAEEPLAQLERFATGGRAGAARSLAARAPLPIAEPVELGQRDEIGLAAQGLLRLDDVVEIGDEDRHAVRLSLDRPTRQIGVAGQDATPRRRRADDDVKVA